MSIKEDPGSEFRKPIKVIIEHDEAVHETGQTGVEVVSLAIDDLDTGNDPYNQTGRFVSLALKDKRFD